MKSEGNFEVEEKKQQKNLEKTCKNLDEDVHFCALLSLSRFFPARPLLRPRPRQGPTSSGEALPVSRLLGSVTGRPAQHHSPREKPTPGGHIPPIVSSCTWSSEGTGYTPQEP